MCDGCENFSDSAILGTDPCTDSLKVSPSETKKKRKKRKTPKKYDLFHDYRSGLRHRHVRYY